MTETTLFRARRKRDYRSGEPESVTGAHHRGERLFTLLGIAIRGSREGPHPAPLGKAQGGRHRLLVGMASGLLAVGILDARGP